MKKNLLIVAAMLPFAAFARDTANVAMTTLSAPLAVTTTASSVTYSFTNQSFDGFSFIQLAPDTAALGPLIGTFASISVNATLNASSNFTYANDLTIYVDPLPLGTGGLLQVGGFSSLGAAERHEWVDGNSDAPGTTVVETYTLITPLTFMGDASDPAVWLGNGYGAAGTSGTWTGSITLNGIAPIPEPSTWALFALGGLGLAGWVARRRRAEDALQ